MEDRRAEIGEGEQAECALAIEIEHAQIVGFMQIAQDDVEVPAIAFPRGL